ncbi:hypothetical protein ACNKHW_10710 [Shigella flexneri]
MSERTTDELLKTIRCIWAGVIRVSLTTEYYEFVDQFIQAVKQRWPDVLLQFEEFCSKNADAVFLTAIAIKLFF